jgi:hypothetical protein
MYIFNAATAGKFQFRLSNTFILKIRLKIMRSINNQGAKASTMQAIKIR